MAGELVVAGVIFPKGFYDERIFDSKQLTAKKREAMYQIIIENAYKYIKNEGKVFLEIGYDQKNELINLFKENNHYENIYSKKDLGGNDRIIVATVRR